MFAFQELTFHDFDHFVHNGKIKPIKRATEL